MKEIRDINNRFLLYLATDNGKTVEQKVDGKFDSEWELATHLTNFDYGGRHLLRVLEVDGFRENDVSEYLASLGVKFIRTAYGIGVPSTQLEELVDSWANVSCGDDREMNFEVTLNRPGLGRMLPSKPLSGRARFRRWFGGDYEVGIYVNTKASEDVFGSVQVSPEGAITVKSTKIGKKHLGEAVCNQLVTYLSLETLSRLQYLSGRGDDAKTVPLSYDAVKCDNDEVFAKEHFINVPVVKVDKTVVSVDHERLVTIAEKVAKVDVARFGDAEKLRLDIHLSHLQKVAQNHSHMSEDELALFEEVLGNMETKLDEMLAQQSGEEDDFGVSLQILAMEYGNKAR